jgi:YhcH/YjgK/YiaL family protein
MLLDLLSRMDRYTGVIPHLADGLACLNEHREETAPARYSFPGGYLMLQAGETKAADSGDFEAHRTYLDVQVLLEGSEVILWADADALEESVPYDSEKDKVLYRGEGSPVAIRPGMCYICWPHDAHKACRHLDGPTTYRKAVIKLELA